MGSDPRSARALLRRSSTVVAAQAALLLITVALATLVGWEAAVVGTERTRVEVLDALADGRRDRTR